jgi:hypothetical protein
MTEKKVRTANRYVTCFVLALTVLLAGAAAVRLPAQEKPVRRRISLRTSDKRTHQTSCKPKSRQNKRR